jgi:hypothetical protein
VLVLDRRRVRFVGRPFHLLNITHTAPSFVVCHPGLDPASMDCGSSPQ